MTSDDYMRTSTEAQKRVQSAIDCLTLRVQVQTRTAVKEVQARCKLLPNMDKKFETILTLTHENSDKLNQNSDKLNQNWDKLDQNSDKLDQNSDKLGQNSDKLGQNSDKLDQLL